MSPFVNVSSHQSSESKVALVTGASSGIGLETSLELIKKGWWVFGAARRVKLMEPIERSGGKVLSLDLSDDESMKRCVENVLQEAGHIDLLVNNAGFGQAGSVEETSLADARRQFDVNVFGLVRMAQLVLPSMRQRGQGRIVNVSSMAGRFSSPFLGWYHASKYAVEALSDALRVETAPFGIKVAVVEPGLIKTDWGTIAAKSLREVSGTGDYKAAAGKVASFYERVYTPQSRGASEVECIARVIVRASCDRRPKSRYVAGRNAQLFITGRRLLSDRAFDKLVRAFFGL